MSDHELPPIQTLGERVEVICTELASLAEEFEVAETIFKHDPDIRALRHARSALSLSFIIPSNAYIAAAKASYLAAIPILAESLPRVENCNERFTALESACEELLEEFLDGSVGLRSEIIRNNQRDVCLQLFGLMGLIASLTGESDTTLDYYTVCLEQAQSDNIGTAEWADDISPFRSFRSAVRREHEDGDF